MGTTQGPRSIKMATIPDSRGENIVIKPVTNVGDADEFCGCFCGPFFNLLILVPKFRTLLMQNYGM
jgi:hypothetical protein